MGEKERVKGGGGGGRVVTIRPDLSSMKNNVSIFI